MQTTSQLLMIRPVNFGFNPETAVNNAFQVMNNDIDVQQKALAEFDNFVKILQENGLTVTVVEDTLHPLTPDSIFPNNWISFHEDGTIVLYPMYAFNRRKERKKHVLDAIRQKFNVADIIDLTGFEQEHLFLEGTGSMVLDRENKIAYACLSPRTNKEVLDRFCVAMHYKPVLFNAVDANGKSIYHTNVMMCVGKQFVVVCLNAIRNKEEREKLINTIQQTNKTIIAISLNEMNAFAGNMLQVTNNKREQLLIMSTRAYNALSAEHIQTLTQFNRIIYSPLNTIETAGGGSARCMLAEVFLEVKENRSQK